jgi:hypothetical protein
MEVGLDPLIIGKEALFVIMSGRKFYSEMVLIVLQFQDRMARGMLNGREVIYTDSISTLS